MSTPCSLFDPKLHNCNHATYFVATLKRRTSVPSHKLEQRRNLACSLSSGKDMMKNLKPNLPNNQGKNKVLMVVKFYKSGVSNFFISKTTEQMYTY